jgi:hypothetical protein
MVNEHLENSEEGDQYPDEFTGLLGETDARNIVMCVQQLAGHRPADGDVVINSHWIQIGKSNTRRR